MTKKERAELLEAARRVAQEGPRARPKGRPTAYESERLRALEDAQDQALEDGEDPPDYVPDTGNADIRGRGQWRQLPLPLALACALLVARKTPQIETRRKVAALAAVVRELEALPAWEREPRLTRARRMLAAAKRAEPAEVMDGFSDYERAAALAQEVLRREAPARRNKAKKPEDEKEDEGWTITSDTIRSHVTAELLKAAAVLMPDLG
jgi:hypothetical protein